MIGSPYFYYKHTNNRDVAFYLTEKIYTEKGVEIKGYWMNIHDLEVNGIDPYMCDSELYTHVLTPEMEAQWHVYDVEENRYRLRRKRK